jgi:hypothetical protein
VTPVVWVIAQVLVRQRITNHTVNV